MQGDDYQHLLTWYYALKLLPMPRSDPAESVTRVEFEAAEAGHVDDIVVYWRDRAEYIQVKFATDGRGFNNSEWWLDDSRGSSLLQKFRKSWDQLKNNDNTATMILYTNRPRDPNCAAMECISGKDDLLTPRFGENGPRSRKGRERAKWAEHLEVGEQELLEMLGRLKILDGKKSFDELAERVGERHRNLGLRGDREAVRGGMHAVRDWITNCKHSIDREGMAECIQDLELEASPPRATLLVQEIGYDHSPDSATVALNWVGLFDGEEPSARRRIKDPAAWNERMRPDLADAAAEIRRRGYNEVWVRGLMRLPSWFAVGAVFSDVADWRIMCNKKNEIWDSSADPLTMRSKRRRERVGPGPDLAVSLSVSASIRTDVRKYIKAGRLPVGVLLDLEPPDGASDRVLSDASTVRGWARDVRDAVRQERGQQGDMRLHLFLATPDVAAMLLGYIWNRVPETLLYADLNTGYAPAYRFPV